MSSDTRQSPKQQTSVARLVAVKCEIAFTRMAQKWDTGTQVSIMSRQWLHDELLD